MNRDYYGFSLLVAAVVLLIFAMFSANCSTEHKINASGTSRVEHVITVEFGVCDAIEDQVAKAECVRTLLQILEDSLKEKNK